ncbi:phycobiliprotein lyase [Pseudanabaenaceae cyanobacterium LEGE 13415]|nr:phycobiliprotein lyase [Pseudanabaenaceae cyanobacterium LEGE 13415]
MLDFQEFFNACSGLWKTERIYHYMQNGEIERSYTEFQVNPLTDDEKDKLLMPNENLKIDRSTNLIFPGFSIAFDTVSETGDRVSMSLKALFVPDSAVTYSSAPKLPMPVAAEVTEDAIQGFYLRDEGYSEGGAIAGRFTYQPTRQTLEMTTHYKRSVAVDQMRFISPDTRLRTIVTYQRPEADQVPTVTTLIGFGVERKS